MITVCSLESRRGDEMRGLIERAGGRAVIAPSMKEVPLDDRAPVFTFLDRLLAGEVDLFIFLTGVGARALLEAAATRHNPAQVTEAINRTKVLVRGPKPVPVLKEAGIRIDLRAPEPNTWREILAVLDDAGYELNGRRVVIQEYGAPNRELEAALRSRGASVETVAVYRWGLPDDLAPLNAAIESTIRGEFQGLLFTSAQQAVHVLRVAEQLGLRDQWLEAANRCVIGSIGPTATETLVHHGLTPDVEPEHGKMGHLVRAFFEEGPRSPKWPAG